VQAPAQATFAFGPTQVQFYNSYCCGSALSLNPGGLEYVPVTTVPEPAGLPLWLGGLAATGWALRRRLPA